VVWGLYLLFGGTGSVVGFGWELGGWGGGSCFWFLFGGGGGEGDSLLGGRGGGGFLADWFSFSFGYFVS